MNKNLVKIVITVALIIIIVVLIVYSYNDSESENVYLENINIGENMELIFFGLEDADSILIRKEDKVLLIDTGEEHHGEYLVKSLLNLEVDEIDYLILTHPDKDHIGGAKEIINNFEVKNIIQSPLEKGTKLQEVLNEEIRKKTINMIIPEKLYEINFGDTIISVFPPEKDYYKKSNNYSLLTLIKHNKMNYFFGGDAEKKRLEEALEYDLPTITLYKVPHHGRNNSKSAEMIEKLSPKVAVITNYSAENEVLEALNLQKTKMYYTGETSIRFISNGLELIERDKVVKTWEKKY